VTGEALLSARDVTFGYGGYGGDGGDGGAGGRGTGGRRFRLDGVSLALDPGEILGVIGPNGSGKTTLIRLLSRVHQPEAGDIRLGGVPLGRLARRDVARQVAVVPQDLALAFPVSVEELCLMGRHPHAEGRFFEGPRDLAAVREALALAGVLDLRDAPVDTLSGGERQRVLVARALAQEPRVLLLDEPTSHLDLRHQRDVAALLARLRGERRMAILLVSHDLNLAAEVADRLLLLASGRMVRTGPPADVLDERTLASAYGCPVWVEKNPVSGRPMIGVRL
jgi:iron complex transport system ATP-binding protein